MEFRTSRVQIRRVLALGLGAALTLVTFPSADASADAPAATSSWTRPVPGRVVRPFVAPRARYAAGHRGVDLDAPAGTPVAAAGSGRVAFAGSVAGTLHVVVDHAGGVKTSVSFLATVTVRVGRTVVRGQQVGTAGGTGPEHEVGVLHFGVRVQGDYIDPMLLFAAVDLTEAVHLAPVRNRPEQQGYDTPAGEARELAQSLHVPTGIPGLEPEPEPSLWDEATDAMGHALSGVIEVGSVLGQPLLISWHAFAKYTPLGDTVEDLRLMGSRLVDYVESRDDCTEDTAAAPGGGGSGHLLFAVGGINSKTDPKTGKTFDLDTRALGYHADEAHWFSYAANGGRYAPTHTYSDLVAQGARMGDQLRALARANPGREVDLVAHSQGGVVVDAFLAFAYDPADPTLPALGNVVTLSSPHQGAPAAQVAAEVRASPNGRRLLDAVDDAAGGALPPTGGRSTRQLDPNSKLMRRLRDEPIPEPMDATSVGATDDPVVPASATEKRGARSVMTNPKGWNDHSAILRDPQSMTAARLALELRPPACVGWVEGIRGAIEPVVIRRVEISLGRGLARVLDPPVVPSPVPFPIQP